LKFVFISQKFKPNKLLTILRPLGKVPVLTGVLAGFINVHHLLRICSAIGVPCPQENVLGLTITIDDDDRLPLPLTDGHGDDDSDCEISGIIQPTGQHTHLNSMLITTNAKRQCLQSGIGDRDSIFAPASASSSSARPLGNVESSIASSSPAPAVTDPVGVGVGAALSAFDPSLPETQARSDTQVSTQDTIDSGRGRRGIVGGRGRGRSMVVAAVPGVSEKQRVAIMKRQIATMTQQDLAQLCYHQTLTINRFQRMQSKKSNEVRSLKRKVKQLEKNALVEATKADPFQVRKKGKQRSGRGSRWTHASWFSIGLRKGLSQISASDFGLTAMMDISGQTVLRNECRTGAGIIFLFQNFVGEALEFAASLGKPCDSNSEDSREHQSVVIRGADVALLQQANVNEPALQSIPAIVNTELCTKCFSITAFGFRNDARSLSLSSFDCKTRFIVRKVPVDKWDHFGFAF